MTLHNDFPYRSAGLECETITKKRPRRALAAWEVGALLKAAGERPARKLLTIRHGPRAGELGAKVSEKALARAEALGRERVLAYTLALWTGLRRSELAALEWRDVDLDTLPPRMLLRAATTKAKRGDTLALHPQIAAALTRARPVNPEPTARVLRTVPGMNALRADLALAGIDDENEQGRVDLHAMRKSLATFLAGQGVPQRIAQAHMRHTDRRLTAGVYTDEKLLPTAAAISALPWLPTGPAPERNEARATGTDGRAVSVDADGAQRQAQQSQGKTGTHGAQTGALAQIGIGSAAGRNCPEGQDLALAVTKRVKGLEPSTFTLAT